MAAVNKHILGIILHHSNWITKVALCSLDRRLMLFLVQRLVDTEPALTQGEDLLVSPMTINGALYLLGKFRKINSKIVIVDCDHRRYYYEKRLSFDIGVHAIVRYKNLLCKKEKVWTHVSLTSSHGPALQFTRGKRCTADIVGLMGYGKTYVVFQTTDYKFVKYDFQALTEEINSKITIGIDFTDVGTHESSEPRYLLTTEDYTNASVLRAENPHTRYVTVLYTHGKYKLSIGKMKTSIPRRYFSSPIVFSRILKESILRVFGYPRL